MISCQNCSSKFQKIFSHQVTDVGCQDALFLSHSLQCPLFLRNRSDFSPHPVLSLRVKSALRQNPVIQEVWHVPRSPGQTELVGGISKGGEVGGGGVQTASVTQSVRKTIPKLLLQKTLLNKCLELQFFDGVSPKLLAVLLSTWALPCDKVILVFYSSALCRS